MFPANLQALCMHQINGFDHLRLGARMEQEAELGPARIYVERSYFFADTVYVGADSDKSVLPWLKQVGLAPGEVIEIPHACLFQGLKESAPHFADLQKRVKAGGRPFFFRTTALEEQLIGRLGIDWRNTLSCDPDIAEKLADKAYIRRAAVEAGEDKIFPPHIALSADWRPEQIEAAVWKIERNAKALGMREVVVKRTDLASGDGFCVWTSGGRYEFCQANQGHELIVEAWINPHVPISNQWLIFNGEARYVGTSRQLQQGFVHKGNVIASDDRAVDFRISERLRHMTRPILAHAIKKGYNGIIGFDAVYHVASDRLWLTEANARVTAGTYAYALASRLNFKPWAVACKIIEPKAELLDFDGVISALEYLPYRIDRPSGIVPYMLSGLRLPQGQRRLGIMAVADYPDSAEHFLNEAEKRLGALAG